jgi:hypothetical protein
VKIEYGTETIGDDSAGDFITPQVGRSHNRTVQTEPLMRSAFASFFGRKNIVNGISFNVAKEHADGDAAVEYVFSYPDLLPESGTLRITNGDTSYEMTAYLVSAQLVDIVGRSTTFSFTFTGGAIIESA